MSKLHYCIDGTSVTDKVLRYQQTKENDDYVPIKLYYDNFRDWWYRKLQDYLDRETFDADYDFKLCKAVDTFDEDQARAVAEKYGLNFLGMFNRWFYRILSNWRSNAKSSAFRVKNRPPVQCPVCGRFVPRINDEHLSHYKTISDLPRFFVRDGMIYKTETSPSTFATVWGKYTRKKLQLMQRGDTKIYLDERKKIRWPFFQKDRSRGVVCPFTKKIVPAITNEYIRGLHKRHNRYAVPMRWSEFQEEHPVILIQSEIYSVDRADNRSDDAIMAKDYISKEYSTDEADHTNLDKFAKNCRFEHSFNMIDYYVEDELDRKILKLVAVGYTVEDIADSLEMEKKDVRLQIRDIRDSCIEMESRLLE